MSSNSFTGVQVLHVMYDAIAEVYQHKSLPFDRLEELMIGPAIAEVLGVPVPNNSWRKYPNLFLVLTAYRGSEKSTAIVRVGHKNDEVWLMHDYAKTPVFGLQPKNKEQNMLLNTLADSNVKCQVIIGKAGSGKTIVTLAWALHQMMNAKGNKFERIILTRPMSSVGKEMGAFPGEAEEKFMPYLGNFYDNLDYLGRGMGFQEVDRLLTKVEVEFKPMALIGGSSWHNSIVIADEVQSLSPLEMYALGTRPAEGSKLILMGDYRQRYGAKTSVESTGLHKFVNSEVAKGSGIVGIIELIKQERSPLAEVFSKVFEE